MTASTASGTSAAEAFRERARALLPQPADWRAVKRNPRRNVLAGVTVAIIALPLALAFGDTSGLGARAGLVTAIVAGAIAAVFGGSNLQVSGPTGAMTVVLIPIVHRFGPRAVLMVGLMAGIILISMAAIRMGRFMRYIPVPVIEGFTAGIAVVIALQQVPTILGVATPDGDKAWSIAFKSVRSFLHHPHFGPAIMAFAVAALILVGARWKPAVPFSLIAVVGATAVGVLTTVFLPEVGVIPAGIPHPSLAFVDIGAFWTLGTAAVAVAALAALESLMSATVADAMTVSEHHDPDRELFGLGLANVVSPIFGGIPATAAIARTAVNVRAGATSKLASFTHAMALLVVVAFASRWVGHIPRAALAGVLLATTFRMVEVGALRAVARSTRQDGIILVLTFTLTVAVDLMTAVALGLGVAIVLALRAVAQSVRVDLEPIANGADHTSEEHALLSKHVVAYRLEGPLFFAAAHRFLLELTEEAVVQVVILRMSRVTAMDATGAQVLGDAVERLEQRGIIVLLSGIRPGHEAVLSTLGVAEHLRSEGRIFADTPSAIEYAYVKIGATSADHEAE